MPFFLRRQAGTWPACLAGLRGWRDRPGQGTLPLKRRCGSEPEVGDTPLQLQNCGGQAPAGQIGSAGGGPQCRSKDPAVNGREAAVSTTAAASNETAAFFLAHDEASIPKQCSNASWRHACPLLIKSVQSGSELRVCCVHHCVFRLCSWSSRVLGSSGVSFFSVKRAVRRQASSKHLPVSGYQTDQKPVASARASCGGSLHSPGLRVAWCSLPRLVR